MLNTIRRTAEEKGITIKERLKSHGLLGDDILEDLKKRNDALQALVNAARQLVKVDKRITGRNPKNDEERVVQGIAEDEISGAQAIMHAMGQTNMSMGILLHADKTRREDQKLSIKGATGEELDK